MKRYRGVLALAEREIRRACTLWPTGLLGTATVWGVLMLGFGVTLSPRIGVMGGVSYRVFIVPGMCTTVLAHLATTVPATSLWRARHDRYINATLCAPMRHAEIMLGYVLGGSFRPLVTATGLFGAGALLVGVPVKRPLVLLGAGVLTLVLFGTLGVILAILCDTLEHLDFATGAVVQSLIFVSGVYFSTSALPTPYRVLIRLDPVFYVTQAIRAGLLGTADTPPWLSLAITAALATAMLASALWLATGKRLAT
jgi:ABC-2 type transport system permease protein